MRARLLLILGAIFVLCQFSVFSGHATFINGGFEAGDSTGWTLYVPLGGSSNVVTSHAGNPSTHFYFSMEGSYFLELKTDGADSYTTASQNLIMSAGDVVDGWAAFDYQDYNPYNDNAAVVILAGSTEIIKPWYKQGNNFPDYWDGSWEHWSWTAPTAGLYTLEFRISNEGDNQLDSYALFDANFHTPVPEPSTMLLLSAGLAGLLGIGRKKLRMRRNKGSAAETAE